MPYIDVSDRGVYKSSLEATLDAVRRGKNQVEQAEMVAWWSMTVIRRFAGQPESPSAFGALVFDGDSHRELKRHAEVVASILQTKYRENDPNSLLSVAGHINYCLSAVCWGFLDDSPKFDSGRYGTRSMLAQMIRNIRESTVGLGSLRKQMMLQGVLSDVLNEMYRRRTSRYENEKIADNGDVWLDGELLTESLPVSAS